jgi:hypothetical protein
LCARKKPISYHPLENVVGVEAAHANPESGEVKVAGAGYARLDLTVAIEAAGHEE